MRLDSSSSAESQIQENMRRNSSNLAWDDDNGAPVAVDDFPEIVSSDNTYHLAGLVNSDFGMSVSDMDFQLTHEQLIKACKVMLYKFNLQSKKSHLERVELSTLVNNKMDTIEARTKQNVSEVNIFLH